ncbi:MAG: nitrogen fixation protein NifH [Anaerolineae bacterium]|nr:nitrogen fixation protein NifH [Anaerolineae bacterium]NIN96639.1 nitrogen fixation protein NifH [Anaerolineae bacterium]NIQ79672.1 nitrogen fixation protein NifH [Anaerolineae bacterium]
MEELRQHLKGDPFPWLLEEDNPSVRYFTLRGLLDYPRDHDEVTEARQTILTSKPVRDILDAQYPQGYWVKPGRGYSPKYRGTVWQLMFLADLGATPNEAIDRACRSVLQNSFLPEEGLFSATKLRTGTIICLNGNLVRAFTTLGYGDNSTVRTVAQTLAERIAKEGFACRANAASRTKKESWLPCAWGAIKALRAFALIPRHQHSAAVTEAIGRGLELLFSRELTVADYPSRNRRISPLWLRFGFPLAYTSDILEAADVLTQLGHGADQRLRGAIEFVLAKQDEDGRWPLEHTLDRTWTKFGTRGQPSKWVTLRALRMLSRLPWQPPISELVLSTPPSSR